MKVHVAAILLFSATLSFASSLDERPAQVWLIEGKILSVADDGVLVVCPENNKFGLAKPEPDEVVFVQGNFPTATDGQSISCTAFLVGRYHYTSAGNASKTVRMFKARS